VPSNDFGHQEPGTNSEIKHFCQDEYGVDFPLASKETVSGGNAHPFYQWAADQAGEGAAPRWNFHKYLIGPYGELAGVFPSQVQPLDQSVTDAIDKLIENSKA
jgi:glutathione peroxidase